MKSAHESPSREFPAWLPMVLLTALALWLRLGSVPGPWGADSLAYFDAAHGDAAGSRDPRHARWIVVGLVRLALWLRNWSPAAASLPGALLAATVVPALWFGLRRRLGDSLALLPCALWTFLGVAIEEGSEISSDLLAVLPAAAAVGALLVAARRPERPARALVAAGLALGFAAATKETAVFALAGFTVGAFCIGEGRARLRNAATLLVPGVVLFLAATLLVNSGRLGDASDCTARDPFFVSAGTGSFLRRVTIELPAAFLTATQAYGLLFVLALPLIARLPFRALRGDPLAATALAGLLAFDVLPVSLHNWALLPSSRPRFLLCMMPVLLAALADALRERPASKAERTLCLVAAAAGLVFVGKSPWTMVLLPPGLLLIAWTSLPDAIAQLLTDRVRLGVTAAVLLAGVVAWPRLASTPTGADWAVACAAAVLVTTPWLVGRDSAPPLPRFAVAASLVLAVAMTTSRFVPDAGWNAWSKLPPSGRVYAETIVARRLRAASYAAGADASRVVQLEPDAPAPRGLAPDDRVLARDMGSLTAGLRLADSCRLPGSGLREVKSELGELVLFEPARP